MYGDWTRDNKAPEELFSVNTLSRTCNVSRATLLRMEQDGLLKPAYINPDNSYRFYDYKSIAEVMRILNYQQLGFTKKEIAQISNNPELLRDNIENIKEHYEFVLRELEDLSLKMNSMQDITIRETKISSGYYFKKSNNIIYSPEHIRRFALNGLKDFVSNKLVGTGQRYMQLFIDEEENNLGSFDHNEHRCSIIIPSNKSDNPNTIYQESFKALMLVCQHNYYKSDALFKMLWEEAITRNLKPIGPIKVMGLPEIVFDSIPGGDNNTLRLLLRVQ